MIKNIIKSYNELKYLAYHDSLTGLYNRNWLYKNSNKINYKYVYFIDINNLHQINQRGHIVGDNHIKSVIESINYDKNNILMRYAGDEFILFSNHNNLISSNILYSVGISENKNNIMNAINDADLKMLSVKVNRR